MFKTENELIAQLRQEKSTFKDLKNGMLKNPFYAFNLHQEPEDEEPSFYLSDEYYKVLYPERWKILHYQPHISDLSIKYLHQKPNAPIPLLCEMELDRNHDMFTLQVCEYIERWKLIEITSYPSYTDALEDLHERLQVIISNPEYIFPLRPRDKQLLNMQRQFSGQWPQYVHERRFKTDRKYRQQLLKRPSTPRIQKET